MTRSGQHDYEDYIKKHKTKLEEIIQFSFTNSNPHVLYIITE